MMFKNAAYSVLPSELWDSLVHLSDIWRSSRLAQSLESSLQSAGASTTNGEKSISAIDASFRLPSTEPLLCHKWIGLAAQTPVFDHSPTDDGGYLREVAPLGRFAELQTSWIRSRFPGFPYILAPQLHKLGPLYNRDQLHGLPWEVSFPYNGMQYILSPPDPTGTGIDGSTYSSAFLRFVSALRSTKEWKTFSDLTQSLSKEDQIQLRRAHVQLDQLLNIDTVEDESGPYAVERQRVIQSRTEEVVNSLTGAAGDYARAFGKLNSLVDFLSITVLGSLIYYRDFAMVSDPTEVSVAGGEISFESADFWNVGRLCLLRSPLAPYVCSIFSVRVHWEATGESRHIYKAIELPGFHQARFAEAVQLI